MRILPTGDSTRSRTRARLRTASGIMGCGREQFFRSHGDALFDAADALRSGKIVAVKGIGGFHLHGRRRK